MLREADGLLPSVALVHTVYSLLIHFCIVVNTQNNTAEKNQTEHDWGNKQKCFPAKL